MLYSLVSKFFPNAQVFSTLCTVKAKGGFDTLGEGVVGKSFVFQLDTACYGVVFYDAHNFVCSTCLIVGKQLLYWDSKKGHQIGCENQSCTNSRKRFNIFLHYIDERKTNLELWCRM